MKILSVFAVAALAAFAGAQSNTIAVNPMGTGLTWNGASGHTNYIDLDVTDPNGVTLQALSIPVQNPGGTPLDFEVWTLSGSHIGNEANAGAWSLIATASGESGGFGVLNTVCLEPVSTGSTFLATGQYGLAIVYTNCRAQFFGVTTYPTGPYSGPGLDVDNGAASAGTFGAPLLNFTFNGILHVGCVPNLDVIYANGNVPHACATVASIGEGSNLKSASAFDQFDEPNASADASAALQGNTLSFIPDGTGTGYIITQGAATFVPATGAETNLPIADNQEVQVTLTVPIQIPTETGITLSFDLFINDNGYVSFDATPGGQGSTPIDPQGAMQADTTTYYVGYHDFDNSEPGSGMIWYLEDLGAGKTYVTWDAVESDPAGTANPSTLQAQIDHATGQIDVVYEVIDPVGGSNIIGGDNWLIGWSPAGPSPRTEEFDFTTIGTTPLQVNLPETLPTTLSASGPPLIGQSFDLTTDNVPANSIGLNLLATSRLDPPFDLSVLGAPAGAVTHIDPNIAIINTVSNVPGVGSLTLTLPVANVPALAGLEITSQSFLIDFGVTVGFPFVNIVSSNALVATVGNF